MLLPNLLYSILIDCQAVWSGRTLAHDIATRLYPVVELHQGLERWRQQPFAGVAQVFEAQSGCWHGFLICQPCIPIALLSSSPALHAKLSPSLL